MAEADLPEIVISTAIQHGSTPRAIETAVAERGADDTLLMLAVDTEVSMTLIGALAERWGIAEKSPNGCIAARARVRKAHSEASP